MQWHTVGMDKLSQLRLNGGANESKMKDEKKKEVISDIIAYITENRPMCFSTTFETYRINKYYTY